MDGRQFACALNPRVLCPIPDPRVGSAGPSVRFRNTVGNRSAFAAGCTSILRCTSTYTVYTITLYMLSVIFYMQLSSSYLLFGIIGGYLDQPRSEEMSIKCNLITCNLRAADTLTL